MNILYNTNFDIANDLTNFFNNVEYHLFKPQTNMISNILSAIVTAENITTLDISKCFTDNSLLINNDSIQKKIWRFLNNPRFNGLDFYNAFISNIISNLKSIKHNKITVIIDHMLIRNHFVILMFTLKVGTQGIPLWFKYDKTKSNRHHEIDYLTKKNLFSERVIFAAVREVIKLLNPLNIKITFLADRWFCNLKLMKPIDESGNYFCIRAKVNSNIKVYIYDKKRKTLYF